MTNMLPRWVPVLLGLGTLGLGLAFRGSGADESSAAPAISFGHSRTVPEEPVRLAAVGDGRADDTQALQDWIDSGRERGGRLHFPSGTYRLTRPLVIKLDDIGPVSVRGEGTVRLVMEGPGPALKVVGTHHTGTAAPRTVQPNVWENQRMPLIDGIEVVGNHPEACGIEITGTMKPTITRVTVRRALHGLHLTARNRNVQISDCHLYHNEGVGIYLDSVNLHQINIVGCHISYNKQGGIVCRDSEIRNLQIGTCDIEGNMSPETPPTANILLDCRTGSIREGAIVGCTIQHSANAPDSANIRFLGQSPDVAQKVGHFTIADNHCSDVHVNIHIQSARGVTIIGNSIHQAFTDLLVEDSSNIVVGPNALERNPDYRTSPYRPRSGEPAIDGIDRMFSNGVLFRRCKDCTLTGLHINGVLGIPAALVLEECQWMNVSSCTLLDNDGCGLLLKDCQNVFVTGCLVRDQREQSRDPVAVRIVGGQNVRLGENLLAGSVEEE